MWEPSTLLQNNGFNNIKEKVNNILQCVMMNKCDGSGESEGDDSNVSGLANIFTILPLPNNPGKIYIDFTDKIKSNMVALYDANINTATRTNALNLVEPSQNDFNKFLEAANDVLLDFVKLYNNLKNYRQELEKMRVFLAPAAEAPAEAPAADAVLSAPPSDLSASLTSAARTAAEAAASMVEAIMADEGAAPFTVEDFIYKLNKFLELFKINNLKDYTKEERNYMNITSEINTDGIQGFWITKKHYDRFLFLNARPTLRSGVSRAATIDGALRYPFLFYRAPPEDTQDLELINGEGKLYLKSNQRDEGPVLDFYNLLNNLSNTLISFEGLFISDDSMMHSGGGDDDVEMDREKKGEKRSLSPPPPPSPSLLPPDRPAQRHRTDAPEDIFWNEAKLYIDNSSQNGLYSADSNFYRLYKDISEYIDSYDSIVKEEEEEREEREREAREARDADKIVSFDFDIYIKKIISDKPKKITYTTEPLLPNKKYLRPFWYAFIEDCIHNILGENGNNCEEEIVVRSEKDVMKMDVGRAGGDDEEATHGTTMIFYSTQDADHFEWRILKEIFHKRNEHFIKFFNDLDSKDKDKFISVDWITDGDKQKYNCPEYHKNYRIDNGKYAGAMLKDIIRDIKLYCDDRRSPVYKFVDDKKKNLYDKMVVNAKKYFFAQAKEDTPAATHTSVPHPLSVDKSSPIASSNGLSQPDTEADSSSESSQQDDDVDAAMSGDDDEIISGDDSGFVADDDYKGGTLMKAGKKTRKHRKIKIPKFSKDKNKKNKKKRKETKNKKHKKGKTFKKKHKKTKRKD